MQGKDKEELFHEAIKEYGSLINKICYYFSSNDEEFKDLRQDIFINIWRGLDKFQGQSKLSTWIYRVCFNTCISFQRKESKKNRMVPIESFLDLQMEEEESKVEKYKKMHALIQKLNYQERVLILLWLDEKNYEEIADLMGLTRNNVAVKLMRIKEKLVKMSRL